MNESNQLICVADHVSLLYEFTHCATKMAIDNRYQSLHAFKVIQFENYIRWHVYGCVRVCVSVQRYSIYSIMYRPSIKWLHNDAWLGGSHGETDMARCCTNNCRKSSQMRYLQ